MNAHRVYLDDYKECEFLIEKYYSDIQKNLIKGLIRFKGISTKLNKMYLHSDLLEILYVLREYHLQQIRMEIRAMPKFKTLSQTKKLKSLRSLEKTYMNLLANAEYEKESFALQSNNSDDKSRYTENNANGEKSSSQKQEKSWWDKFEKGFNTVVRAFKNNIKDICFIIATVFAAYSEYKRSQGQGTTV